MEDNILPAQVREAAFVRLKNSRAEATMLHTPFLQPRCFLYYDSYELSGTPLLLCSRARFLEQQVRPPLYERNNGLDDSRFDGVLCSIPVQMVLDKCTKLGRS